MDRRMFVGWMGGAIVCPGITLAQSAPARIPRVCFLSASLPSSMAGFRGAFLEGMREHGWVEGQNVQIDYLWAEGRNDLLQKLADDAVALKYDVIFATGLTPARVVQARTTTIPIVSALLHDPVAEGFAKSWSRPGGNLTGTSTVNHDLLTKRVQILRELVPRMKTLAVVFDPALPNLRHGVDEIKAIGGRLGIRVAATELVAETEIERVFGAMRRQRVDAVIAPAYPLITSRRSMIAAAAARLGMPVMGEYAEFAIDGGLASHGPDWVPLFRRSASHVDRILRGAKPGDLPIEQPTRYELVLNQRTASALRIKFPHSLLLRADRVIE